MYIFKNEIFNDSFLESLPFVILTTGRLNSLSPGKKNIIHSNTFPFPVQSSQITWFWWQGTRFKEFLISHVCAQIPNCSFPQLLMRYHCVSLNVGTGQLWDSHWESPIYPCTALCTEEALKFCDVPKSVK